MSPHRRDGPPRLAESLLRRAAPPARAQWVIGDLREEHAQRRRAGEGRLRADLWHSWQAFRIAGRLALHHRRRRRESASSRIPQDETRTAMSTLLQDLRFGLRNVTRNPTFAVVAVVALAIGIGANTAIFSVVYGVLQDLPYPGGERIVLAYEDPAGDGSGRMPLAGGEVVTLDDRGDLFDGFVAYTYSMAILGGEPHPESVSMPMISHDFLDFLETTPSPGRDFAESDLGSESRVVLVGHDLWQRRWNGDPDLVGREIEVNGTPFTVVGIAPPEFDYFNDTDRIYGLLDLSGPGAADFRQHRYYTLARLPEAASLDAVQDRVTTLVESAQEAGGHPAERPRGLVLYSLYEAWVGNVREPLLMLMGAVGLLVLLACSNVANLQIAQGIRRRRELAVRVAMGASRARIFRQLLTESALLALAGGACGLLLAWLSMHWLRVLVGSNLPRVGNIGIDGTTLAFTVGLSLAAGIASGLVPGMLVSARAPAGTLQQGSVALASGRGNGRARSALLVIQLGLAVVLTVGATLLAASFAHVQTVDMGIRTEDVMTTSLAFWGRPAEYPDAGAARPVLEEVVGQVEAFPEVRAAGLIDMLPGTGRNVPRRFAVEDDGQERSEPLQAGSRIVTPGYLEAADLSLLSGRGFGGELGEEGSRPVALVDARFAELAWPDGDAIGQRIRQQPLRPGQDPGPWTTVIGVVEGTRLSPYADDTQPLVYFPLAQQPSMVMSLVAHMRSTPADFGQRLRAAVERIDPGQPVTDPVPLDDLVAAQTARQRLNTVLMASLAVLALLLAAVGEYAVLQHHAARRSREIGIRMALGARGANVVRLVVRRGLLLAALGVAIGLGGAWIGSRYLQSMLHGIEPHDVRAYLAVAGVLAVVALLASLLPARRAARTDPMQALRTE